MTRHGTMRYGTMVMLAALVLGACARASNPPSSPAPANGAAANATGARDSRSAVDAFMRAVKAQDLQQMAAIWGTTKGPARDQFQRDELEKRLIVIQCMLSHDSWRFAEEGPRLQTGGRQEFLVTIQKKSARATTTFTTVQGPAQRWYVEIVDVAPLRDFCQ